MFYGMPIHIIRDVALTIRSFHKRITDFVRYRQATHDMNARYPDATSEEVNREDCCIICREDMRAWPQQLTTRARQGGSPGNNVGRDLVDERLRPKKLPCGHVLHVACLRSWLERQQNCPTCRAPVLVPHAVRQSQTQQVPNPATRAQREPPLPQNQAPGHANGNPAMARQNVYQLGPFRVAFGARNVAQGLPPLVDQPQPDRATTGVDVPRLRDTFGPLHPPGPAQTRNIANFGPLAPSTQLQHIEHQLIREINSLRLQADQLYSVRALQNELSRLRTLQTNLYTTSLSSVSSNQYRPTSSFSHAGQAVPNGPIFTSNQISQGMGSGHEHLPAGMAVPEGWTVLPLQRIPNPSDSRQPNLRSIHRSLSRSSAPTSSDLEQADFLDTPESSISTETSSTGNTTPRDGSAGMVVDDRDSESEERSTGPGAPLRNTTHPGTNNRGGITAWGKLEAAKPDENQSEQRCNQHHGSTQPGKNGKGKGRASTVEDSAEDVD